MIAEIGQYALVLAFALSLAQSALPMIGAQRGIRPWMAFARPAAFAGVYSNTSTGTVRPGPR